MKDEYHIIGGYAGPMIKGMGMMPASINVSHGPYSWYGYWRPRVIRLLIRRGEFRDQPASS